MAGLANKQTADLAKQINSKKYGRDETVRLLKRAELSVGKFLIMWQ